MSDAGKRPELRLHEIIKERIDGLAERLWLLESRTNANRGALSFLLAVFALGLVWLVILTVVVVRTK